MILWHTSTGQLGSILKTTSTDIVNLAGLVLESLLLKQNMGWKLGMLALIMYIERLFQFQVFGTVGWSEASAIALSSRGMVQK
jgi:hypothetical protein